MAAYIWQAVPAELPFTDYIKINDGKPFYIKDIKM